MIDLLSPYLCYFILLASGLKPIMCRFDGCEEIFTYKSNRQRHELIHSGEHDIC